MINSVVDLLVCTLFGSEAATEITLSGLNIASFPGRRRNGLGTRLG